MMAALEEQTGAGRDEIQDKLIMYNPNGGMTVDAVDPKKPTELNQYVSNLYTENRTVTPYDYGGAERYEDLKATLFPANQVTPEMVVTMFNDSFDRVTGDKAELRGKWVVIEKDHYGELGVSVTNGTERDQQVVYYDPTGQFVEVM